MDRKTLEEYRRDGKNVYGYKRAYCKYHSCCDGCDKTVRFWCKVICAIEKLQIKRILNICK